jgi:hypothetical protein
LAGGVEVQPEHAEQGRAIHLELCGKGFQDLAFWLGRVQTLQRAAQQILCKRYDWQLLFRPLAHH